MRKIFKLFYSRRGQQIWLIALFLFPLILWILPSDYFDSEGLILCPSRLFFGIECFGCGITRAIMHMHHFQFDEAVYFNTLALIVYPALIAVWGFWIWKAGKRLGYLPFKNKD